MLILRLLEFVSLVLYYRKAGLPELVLLLFWISTFMLLLFACCVQFFPKPNVSQRTIILFLGVNYRHECQMGGRFPLNFEI